MITDYRLPFLLRFDAGLLATILFALMLSCIMFGRKIGRRQKAKLEYHENPANATLYTAVFALLSFLLGFTFAMSGSRYDARRMAPIAEANDISAAILRADFFPDSDRVIFRNDLKHYLQARIDFITAEADKSKVLEATRQDSDYSNRLWKHLVQISRENPGSPASIQMMQALSNMFNSARSNLYGELMKVPQAIVLMLFVLALVSAFLIGYASVAKGRFDWFVGVSFCILTCLVIFITLNLDRERRGIIKLTTSDEAILSLMKQVEQP